MKLSQNARPRQKRGQHTLEYLILMTLIMAGIIIGGPYVIRSWNAQMKGWEDSVVDSMTDPLTEAPSNIVTITGCDFVSWGSCGWGDCCGKGYDWFDESIDCTAQQLLQRGVFSPPDCQLSDTSINFGLIARCDTNDANHCCTSWAAVTSGCNPDDLTAVCPTDSDCGVNAVSITGVRADGQAGCEDGAYGQTHTCDTGYTETECVADPDCAFTCGGLLTGSSTFNGTTSPPTLQYATFCTGDNAGLSGDTDYVITVTCTSAKCEFVCNPSFVSYGTYCGCPSGQTVVDGVCVCADGYAVQGVCPDGYCLQGPCALWGSNYCLH
ncbi:MAG: hypothetical protein HZC18_05750 [Candidatus Omnitrophica bacterium]|nr:hypothetical protein [Candidatus Omnitrophota bacterium]